MADPKCDTELRVAIRKLTFLDMPREVRDQVYAIVLTSRTEDPPDYSRRGLHDMPCCNHDIKTAIMQTNRQIHNEGKEVLLKENLFVQVSCHSPDFLECAGLARVRVLHAWMSGTNDVFDPAPAVLHITVSGRSPIELLAPGIADPMIGPQSTFKPARSMKKVRMIRMHVLTTAQSLPATLSAIADVHSRSIEDAHEPLIELDFCVPFNIIATTAVDRIDKIQALERKIIEPFFAEKWGGAISWSVDCLIRN